MRTDMMRSTGFGTETIVLYIEEGGGVIIDAFSFEVLVLGWIIGCWMVVVCVVVVGSGGVGSKGCHGGEPDI